VIGLKRLSLCVAAVAMLAGCAAPATDAGPVLDAPPAGNTLEVLRVVDGDTIDVAIPAGRPGQAYRLRQRVRLLGIDTPERGQAGYGKATEALRSMIGGRCVRLSYSGRTRGGYGRLLAYVHRADDGLDVNLAMVRGGWAKVVTKYPHRRMAEFQAAKAE